MRGTKWCPFLRFGFTSYCGAYSLHVLNIPDDYQFMDPELVDLVFDLVEPYL